MRNFVKLLSALSDETRLRIYLLLLKGELCVCELVNILNLEQSRISHSLRILKEAGFIDNRREGKWIIYSANAKMAKNKIIQGLKKEVALAPNDLQNLAECKREKIREQCKVK